jgi:hypothetical protein
LRWSFFFFFFFLFSRLLVSRNCFHLIDSISKPTWVAEYWKF